MNKIIIANTGHTPEKAYSTLADITSIGRILIAILISGYNVNKLI